MKEGSIQGVTQLFEHYHNQSFFPVAVIDFNATIVFLNDAALKTIYRNDEAVVGDCFYYWIDKQDVKVVSTYIDLVANNPENPAQFVLRKENSQDGSTIWLECQARLVVENGHSLILLQFQNITVKKQREWFQEVQRSTLEMITKGISLQEVVEALSVHIEESFRRKTYASVLVANQAGDKFSYGFAPNLSSAYNEVMNGLKIGPKSGSCGTAAFRKQQVFTSDIATDPLWDDYREFAIPLGLRSCWSTPIIIAGKVLACFAIYQVEPTTPSAHELEVIEMCAYLVGLAIERKQQEDALRLKNEDEFKMIADHTSDMICMLDRQGNVKYGSPSHEAILGFSESEYMGMSIFDLVHPEDLPLVMQTFVSMVQSHTAGEIEFRYRHKNGCYRMIQAKGKAVGAREDQVESLVFVGRDITEKIKARQRLRESEERYKSLFEQNPDAVYSMDAAGNILFCNRSLERILGYSQEEYLQHFVSFTAPDYVDHTVGRFQQALAGEPQNYHTVGIHKHGHQVDLQVTNIPIVVQEKVVGVYGIVKDVTEKKRIEASLRMREEQLRTLIYTVPDFVLFKDGENRLLEVNKTAIDVFGLEGVDFYGKTFLELIEENPKLKDLYFNCHHADDDAWVLKDNIRFEYEIQKQDGSTVVFDIVKAPYFDKRGKARHIVTVGRDITKRTQMEEELRTTKEQLEALFTHSADSIGTIDLEGKVVHVNPAFERLYGWKKEEMIGTGLLIIPDHLKEEVKLMIDKVQNGEDVIGWETVRKTKDGRLLNVSITLSSVKDQYGNLSLISAFTRDISERKRTEELLNRSEKLSAVGQLAAAVAHEIRNPLTSIKGFIQLFRGQVNQRYVDVMLSELARIETIITEFLSLAKPQATVYEKNDVAVMIKETLEIIDTQAIMNNITIVTEFTEDVPFVFCDQNKIKQVLINVLKNAVESMENGGEIIVQLKTTDKYVHIRVIDEGCGIATDRIPKLGEPFYSSKEKGTGLGLMVCFKIIEEHRGIIEIDNATDKGIEVHIYLPI